MSDTPITDGKTHFADDATLDYIAQLEKDRAALIEALERTNKALNDECAFTATQGGNHYETPSVTIMNQNDVLLSKLKGSV